MTEGSASSSIEVKQMAGPGVPGMEHEAPLYHIDVELDDVVELVSDPVGFMKSIGLGPPQGVAPAGAMNVHFSSSNWTWYAGAWRFSEDAKAAAPNAGVPMRACCWIHDDEMW